MLSKEMTIWLQEQEEDDIDGYLDVDLFIKEWIEKIKLLEEDVEFLTCLKQAGVDNWQGYDYAFDIKREREDAN